ncbi:MAG: PEP-CTERM sorting domain-containing protein [Verrucomicrobiales bacterium]
MPEPSTLTLLALSLFIFQRRPRRHS